jgi:hypothetical protein
VLSGPPSTNQDGLRAKLDHTHPHSYTDIKIQSVFRTTPDVGEFKVNGDRRRRPVFRSCKLDKMLPILVTTLPPESMEANGQSDRVKSTTLHFATPE